MTTPTPHDALFKAAFSIPANAAAELRHVLGPGLAALFAWPTLTLCSGSFVSDALRSRHADLLFTVRARDRDVHLYILYEHKSGPEPWLPLWLLGCMVQIWEAFRVRHPDARTLPVILPVVVAHAEGGWRTATAFEDLLAAPDELLPFVPRFRFALDDLASDDPAAIQRRDAAPFARLTLLALLQARSTLHWWRTLREWLPLLRELRRGPGGPRAERQLFRYLTQVGGFDPAIIETTATDLNPEAKEAMETFAEWYTRKGREEGLQKGLEKGLEKGEQRGLQKGACQMLMRALRRRFGEVPPDDERRIHAADPARLDLWLDRCFEARTLDEVFATP